LATGVAVAGYRVEAVLGHGSTGTVYSAQDVQLERRVALKVLTPELARDVRFRERFLRESKLAASLEHPHIVPIHSAGDADGVLYLAMRYVDGRDLAALLASLGRLDAERTLAILRQVAEALDAAHARGLVHRDVKPANILLGKGDYAYLCDFGLAKHASTVSSLTGSRAILGTVDYLAPEQIEARPVDGRTDVYALGCVLYECLVGEPPHRRENELAALLAHVNEPPPRPSVRRAELPEALDEVIATALAKDRDLRFETCAQVVEAAGAALHGDSVALPQPPEAAAPAVRTFLFADVRGYTSYTRERGDEAGAELARRFAALVGRLAGEHAGALQELRGDEALVVFDSARRALRFAVALQAGVAAEELPRPIGIGVDVGEAVAVDDGYRGGALNRAARLCALARAGETLASDAVCELAGATEGVRFGFRRVERIKGFEKLVGVTEVQPIEGGAPRALSRRAKHLLLGPRPRLRLLAAAVLVGAAVAAVVVLASGGGRRSAGGASSPFRANTVGLLDAKTLKPVGTFDQLGALGSMMRVGGQLWALDLFAGVLTRIDPQTQQVTGHITVPFDFGGIAAGAGSIWISNYDAAEVDRFNPEYGNLIKRIVLPTKNLPYAGLTNGVTFGAGSVWVAYGKYPFRVARIDPATNRVIRTIDFPNSDGPALLAFGGGSLWVASQDKGGVWRVDPRIDSVVAHAKLPGGWVADLTVLDGSAWLPVQDDGAVWQVNGDGQVLRSIPTGTFPVAIGSGGGYLYVANEKSHSIARIDPVTDTVTTVAVGHGAESAAFADGRVWVVLSQTVADVIQGLDRNKIARVATVDDPYFQIDPALYSQGNVQLQEAVGARLLRHPDVAQPNGVTLLPELADRPTVSDGGLTYTFHIRSGSRFSPPSNAPVTAQVMRYSIERALSPQITEPTDFGRAIVPDIVGMKAYRAGKAAHIAGIRVAGDDIVFRLSHPDPDFPERISQTYFSAVPLDTPIRAHGLDQPIPSAGPYYIVGGNTLVLKRNPNYHGPRPHRLDAIVFDGNLGTAALQQVEKGASDYAWSDKEPYPSSLAPGGALEQRFGAGSAAAEQGKQRYFRPVTSGIRMIDFNSESGIFRDPRLRRAVSYALDRPALAAATNDRAWDDLLPPGIPGAGRAPIYPLHGPQLAQARQLAGHARRQATLVVGTPQSCPYCATVGATITADLAQIGIDVTVKTSDNPYGTISAPGAHWDLFLDNWFADYPDPSDFVNGLLDRTHPLPELDWGGASWTRYDDQRYLREMRTALRLSGAARAAAYRRLETDMFRNSPPSAVYAVMLGAPQFFSPRVGCQVFRPQDNGPVDLAALCTRPGGRR
jgi:serine/threonine-protein kinase